MKVAAIFCKASLRDGLGHVVRQVHLAKALQQAGWTVTLFLPDYLPALQLAAEAGLQPRILPAYQGLPDALPDGCRVVVLDVHDSEADWVRRLQHTGARVASFEDWGWGRNAVDLLIDCNLPPEAARNVAPQVTTLFGLPYSLLHPDFAHFHGRSRSYPNFLKRFLITLGGSDPNGLTEPLARLMCKQHPDLQTTVVAGPGFRGNEKLEDLRNESPGITLRRAVTHMAPLLFEHDAVLCSGGVTLHEALCVGTPAFVISQAEHQAEKARALERQGAAVYLGSAGDWTESSIRSRMKISPAHRESLGRKGKALIDGRGLERIVSALEACAR